MKTILTSLLTLLLSSILLATPTDYTIDPVHSTVSFKIKHMMISTVRGEFNAFNGIVSWDSESPEKSIFKGEVEAKSIDTRNRKRDNHLRSPDFFNITQAPVISLSSTRISPVKHTKTNHPTTYEVTADLTLLTTTHSITFPLHVSGPITDPYGNKRLGFEGKFTINREDFGLNWNKNMDQGLVLGKNVEVELLFEAINKK